MTRVAASEPQEGNACWTSLETIVRTAPSFHTVKRELAIGCLPIDIIAPLDWRCAPLLHSSCHSEGGPTALVVSHIYAPLHAIGPCSAHQLQAACSKNTVRTARSRETSRARPRLTPACDSSVSHSTSSWAFGRSPGATAPPTRLPRAIAAARAAPRQMAAGKTRANLGELMSSQMLSVSSQCTSKACGFCMPQRRGCIRVFKAGPSEPVG